MFRLAKFVYVFSFCSVVALSAAFAQDKDHVHPGAKMPASFDSVKALLGQWEGTTKMDGKDTPVTASYEMTAGGTAILERLFAGTPHEMVSVYHGDGNQVAMTHYCMLGNQPKMTLREADKNRMVFEIASTTGIKSAQEPHMHSLSVAMADEDHMNQEWTLFENGKKKDVVVFNLARKK